MRLLILIGACFPWVLNGQKYLDIEYLFRYDKSYFDIGLCNIKSNLNGYEFKIGGGQYGNAKYTGKMRNGNAYTTAFGTGGGARCTDFYSTSNIGFNLNFAFFKVVNLNRKFSIVNKVVLGFYQAIEKCDCGILEVNKLPFYYAPHEVFSYVEAHMNFSLGYSVRMEYEQSKKIKFGLGISLPFFFGIPINNYDPSGKENLMSGLEPVITTSIKYQIKR